MPFERKPLVYRKDMLRFGGLLSLVGMVMAADYARKTPSQIAAEVKKGKAVLLDVRELPEWEMGHIALAKSLPLSTIQESLGKLPKNELFPEGKIVYLHCKAGVRCLKAATLLEKQGIKADAVKAPFEDLKKAFGE